MSDNYVPLCKLAQLTVGHVGPMASEYADEGVPFLRSQNVRPFTLDLAEVKRVSLAFHDRLAKSALLPGDVVVVRTGTPGAAAVIPHGLSPANCSDLVVIRPGPKLDSRYLCYFINGAARGYVDSRVVGAVQQHFNVGSARELMIPRLPIAEQRAIAEVLATLDDKIEANRKLVALCDESWRAALKAEPAVELTPLSKLADFVNGGAFTKGATGSGRMVIRIAELNSAPGASTVYNDLDVDSVHLAGPGDLLFAWSGSLTVARWYRDESIINQHIFKVIPKQGIPIWLIHGAILDLLPYFRGVAADKATTMGHIQRHHLDEEALVPSAGVRAALDRLCTPLWHRALNAERESVRLAALRDALLPKLLSGEVVVRGVETAVGEAI